MEFFANFDKLKNIWFIKKKSLGKEWSEQRDKVVLDAIHTKQKENEGKAMNAVETATAKTTVAHLAAQEMNKPDSVGTISAFEHSADPNNPGAIKSVLSSELGQPNQQSQSSESTNVDSSTEHKPHNNQNTQRDNEPISGQMDIYGNVIK